MCEHYIGLLNEWEQEGTMTQTDMILAHLRKFGSITPIGAFDLCSCMRLGARISDLRKQGFNIKTTYETRENRSGKLCTYARYFLLEDDL